MFADTILILFISIITALLGEGLTWVLVYRTEKYQKLKAEVEKQSKKLEKQKENIGSDPSERSQKKKLERQEERLKTNNRDLSMVKMKSMFAIGFAFTALLSMFNSIFDGKVVCKLPFVPISWLHGISHRNLMGDDFTDCSFIFLYILCTMSIRQFNFGIWVTYQGASAFWLETTEESRVCDVITMINKDGGPIALKYINVQKLLGFAPSRAANKQGTGLFGLPNAPK